MSFCDSFHYWIKEIADCRMTLGERNQENNKIRRENIFLCACEVLNGSGTTAGSEMVKIFISQLMEKENIH